LTDLAATDNVEHDALNALLSPFIALVGTRYCLVDEGGPGLSAAPAGGFLPNLW
jgi:hypothetical protein